MGSHNNSSGFRLGVNFLWPTSSFNVWPIQVKTTQADMFLRAIVRGVLLRSSFLSSEVLIKRVNNSLELSFLVYPLKFSSRGKIPELRHSLGFLKFFLEKKYNVPVLVRARVLNTYVLNADILSGWLSYNLALAPQSLKKLLNSVFREREKYLG